MVDALVERARAAWMTPGRRRCLALKPRHGCRSRISRAAGRPGGRPAESSSAPHSSRLAGAAVLIAPRPAEVTPEAWRLLAIFVGHRRRLDRAAGAGRGDGAVRCHRRRRHRRPDPGAGTGRLRRSDRLDGLLRLPDRRRHDQDRSGPAAGAALHPGDRPDLARPGLRAGRHRRAARDGDPVGQRPRRRHPIPDRQEPGRDLRIDAGTDGRPPRRVPPAVGLSLRRDRLRDVPHRAGVEPADRQLRRGRPTGIDLDYSTWALGGDRAGHDGPRRSRRWCLLRVVHRRSRRRRRRQRSPQASWRGSGRCRSASG